MVEPWEEGAQSDPTIRSNMEAGYAYCRFGPFYAF